MCSAERSLYLFVNRKFRLAAYDAAGIQQHRRDGHEGRSLGRAEPRERRCRRPASTKPASSRTFPTGRRRRPVIATPISASEPATLPAIASTRAGKSSRCSLAAGIDVPATGSTSGTASATPRPGRRRRARPGSARRIPAPSSEPAPSSGAVEEPAEEVVRAKDAVVPACRGAPGDRGGAERVGGETGAPGGELRRAALAPAAGEETGEPQGEERGAEREDRFHRRSLDRRRAVPGAR